MRTVSQRPGEVDDLDEAFNVNVAQCVVNALVVADAEEDATPGDANPLAGTAAVGQVAEDHVDSSPVCVHPVHAGKGIYLRKHEDARAP
jgi:hypothetical protein